MAAAKRPKIVVVSRRKVSFFPTRTKASKSGPKKQGYGFRPPQDVKEYLAVVEARGYTRTEAIVSVHRIVRDIEEELGDAGMERLLQRANAENISLGAMVARLARTALNAKG